MDYEKKYKEALENARQEYNTTENVERKQWLEDLFPELKESEDEKLRKAIVATIHLYYGESLEDEAKKMLSWLEKQSEQILANSAKTCKDEQEPTDEEMKTLLRTEYEKGRADAIAEMQKPAWSEEDEEELDIAISTLKGAGQYDSAKWLKSLKDRRTWKPSDEQIKALHDLNLTGNISYAGQGQVLIELYNDLKKLAEE